MGMSKAQARDTIIKSARNLEPDYFKEEASYDGPGKFEGIHDRELTVALTILRSNGDYDEEIGSVIENGYCLMRTDHFVIEEDDQGFVNLMEFNTILQAERFIEVERSALDIQSDDGEVA